MKKLLLVLVSVLMISTFSSAQSTKSLKKHALAKVFMAPVVVVKKAPTGFAKIAGAVLFGVEVPVDGAHIAFYEADRAFDFLSLQGKIPVLDFIYSGVSVANTDLGKLDTGLESLETTFFGYHN